MVCLLILFGFSGAVRLRACSYGGEPARLLGWSSLPRSHLIPNSNTTFDFCSYERMGWPA